MQGNRTLCTPEDRLHSIKMKHDLPQRWIIKGLTNVFNGETKKGENFTYQLGVYPVMKGLDSVQITFSDLKSKSGQVIPAKVMSCLNTQTGLILRAIILLNKWILPGVMYRRFGAW